MQISIFCFHPDEEFLRAFYSLLPKDKYKVNSRTDLFFAKRWLKNWGVPDLLFCPDLQNGAREWALGLQKSGLPVVMITRESSCEGFPWITHDDALNRKKLLEVINDHIVHTSEHVAGFIPERNSGLC